MFSMVYTVQKISMTSLIRSIFTPALNRRVSTSASSIRPLAPTSSSGKISTMPAVSLWIDGELIHLEDLVLHDAFRDTRTPTHELTIARDVLRTRRRIAAQSPDWTLIRIGLSELCARRRTPTRSLRRRRSRPASCDRGGGRISGSLRGGW